MTQFGTDDVVGPRTDALPRVTLILGGARSGKSRHAEKLVEARLGGAYRAATYIATAQAHDDEMAARIAQHRTRRGRQWYTVEEPHDVPAALGLYTDPEKPVLVDCLTLWLTNLMLADRDADRRTGELLRALDNAKGPVLLVANEVGLGIVPDNALARRFRDAAGTLNQVVAAAADRVVFVAAGLPLVLKGNSLS